VGDQVVADVDDALSLRRIRPVHASEATFSELTV
jgi:hypothetical protein